MSEKEKAKPTVIAAPAKLRAQMQALAKRHDRSLSKECVTALRLYVAALENKGVK